MKITKDELLDLMQEFINDQFLWNEFRAFFEAKGYLEEEIDEILENLNL